MKYRTIFLPACIAIWFLFNAARPVYKPEAGQVEKAGGLPQQSSMISTYVDWYAEALVANGQIASAISCYRYSLLLQADNPHAKEQLEILAAHLLLSGLPYPGH